MPIEKSAGAVIFRRESSFAKATEDKSKIFYLLLHYPRATRRPKPYWDFPKGHIEKGEKIEDTAKRETYEETGLKDIEIVPGFKETIKYFFKWEGKNILKFVTFFLAETKSPQEVKISGEHIGFEWLPFEEAVKKAAFKNAKNILQKANDYLNSKFKSESHYFKKKV